MKITGQRPPGTAELSARKAREAEAQAARAREQARHSQEGATPADNRAARNMQRIRETIRATPDVRSERVEAVREQLRAGQYKVDPDRLADAILNESLRDDVEKP